MTSILRYQTLAATRRAQPLGQPGKRARSGSARAAESARALFLDFDGVLHPTTLEADIEADKIGVGTGLFGWLPALVSALRAPTKKFFARPLLGSVRAGQPQSADQAEPEVLTLDDYLIDEPNRTSLHKVRGDSMRDAGILEGDLVAVEHNAPAAPGDIVVAVVDNEMTVKTLRQDPGGEFFLEAANPAYAAIRPKTSLEILGVVISVARRVRR